MKSRMILPNGSFVPGERPVVEVQRKGLDAVIVELIQNLAGGVGVAGLAALVAGWATLDLASALVAGLVAGLVVFCSATAVRAFADEGVLLARVVQRELAVRQALEYADAEWAERLAAAEDALRDALAEIRAWQAQAATLESDRNVALAEVQQLRSQIAPNWRPARSLNENLRRDAKALAKLALAANRWIGRDASGLGWTPARWQAAQQVLVDAGMIELSGKQVVLRLRDLGAIAAEVDRVTGVNAPVPNAESDAETEDGLSLLVA